MLCFIFYVRTRTLLFFFFFKDPATPEIYPLSLHDALPISGPLAVKLQNRLPLAPGEMLRPRGPVAERAGDQRSRGRDRKSTRLNSSHGYISYAVFCLKKKKDEIQHCGCVCT